MKIRKRDGTVIEVTDSYVLQDGETLSVEVRFMDGMPKPSMFTDSAGSPSGCRPGFLFRDDKIAHAVSETVHAEYRADISDRWKSDRWQSGNLPTAGKSNPPPTLATADAVDASYEQYRHDISNRWKHR